MTGGTLLTGIIGPSPSAFVAVAVVLGGATAWITGHALATGWKPVWQVLLFCLLLATAARFLLFALFAGDLFSLPGYVVTALILLFFGIVSFRANRARKVVSQYPWLYRRQGLFGWVPRVGRMPKKGRHKDTGRLKVLSADSIRRYAEVPASGDNQKGDHDDDL